MLDGMQAEWAIRRKRVWDRENQQGRRGAHGLSGHMEQGTEKGKGVQAQTGKRDQTEEEEEEEARKEVEVA